MLLSKECSVIQNGLLACACVLLYFCVIVTTVYCTLCTQMIILCFLVSHSAHNYSKCYFVVMKMYAFLRFLIVLIS